MNFAAIGVVDRWDESSPFKIVSLLQFRKIVLSLGVSLNTYVNVCITGTTSIQTDRNYLFRPQDLMM